MPGPKKSSSKFLPLVTRSGMRREGQVISLVLLNDELSVFNIFS